MGMFGGIFDDMKSQLNQAVDDIKKQVQPLATPKHFCPSCGSKLADNQKFCSECGASVAEVDSAPQPVPDLKEACVIPSKSNKDGDLIKCPACGAPVKGMDSKCPECGYEFRNRSASKSIADFFDYYYKATPSEKAGIVKTFPIPNSREDLLSFLIMGIGNIKGLTIEERNTYLNRDISIASVFAGGKSEGVRDLQYREQEIAAWRAKVRQVIDMGKLLFKDDETIVLLNKYDAQLTKEQKKLPPMALLAIIAGVLFGLLLMMTLVLYLVGGE